MARNVPGPLAAVTGGASDGGGTRPRAVRDEIRSACVAYCAPRSPRFAQHARRSLQHARGTKLVSATSREEEEALLAFHNGTRLVAAGGKELLELLTRASCRARVRIPTQRASDRGGGRVGGMGPPQRVQHVQLAPMEVDNDTQRLPPPRGAGPQPHGDRQPPQPQHGVMGRSPSPRGSGGGGGGDGATPGFPGGSGLMDPPPGSGHGTPRRERRLSASEGTGKGAAAPKAPAAGGAAVKVVVRVRPLSAAEVARGESNTLEVVRPGTRSHFSGHQDASNPKRRRLRNACRRRDEQCLPGPRRWVRTSGRCP